MKKKKLYTIVIVVFVAMVALIIGKYAWNQNATSYELRQRTGSLATAADWVSTRNNAEALRLKINENAGDKKSMLALSSLFIREARITGDHLYYDAAALHYINEVLKVDPKDFEGLILKSLVQLSQHHFADGLVTAEQARRVNPYNAFVYGILVDGNVEMGNYDSAVANSDHMVSIRPDIRSYSRISYLREIYGDYPGAIEAMKLATGAGIPGDEATEWARIQLGHLYENTGDTSNARMQYIIALNERPEYAYALAGLGHLSMIAKDYTGAAAYYEKAGAEVNDYAFKEDLADVFNFSGQREKANQTANLVIEGMAKDARKGNSDENIGHYADRELAYAYLKVNDYDKALEHAMLEYNRRPNNIDVNEAVAWIYYNKGDYAKALPYIQVALKTNSKNPTLLCRAGLIFEKSGDKITAKSLFTQALNNNPAIAESLKMQSEQVLRML